MLTKSKVAIFSDLHLGIRGNSEEWHKIALDWCKWIVDDLKKNGISDILFLGDFFDNRSEISVQTLHVASEILERLKSFNIIMVVGNHDAYYKNRSDVHSLGLMNGYENLTIVDKKLTLHEFGKSLLFVPWNNDLPSGEYDYIFGHFEIQSFKMNNFKVCDKGFPVMDFLNVTNSVFSGHFHRRDHKKYNEGTIHYVGNTFPMDFADVDNIKGYHILDLEDGKLKFIENPISPKFKKISLSQIKTFKEEDIRGNIVKLIIDLGVDEKQLDKVKSYIGKYHPHQLHVEYNVSVKTIDSVDEVDSFDIEEMFTEFTEQLGLEDDVKSRVKKIIKDLYEKGKYI